MSKKAKLPPGTSSFKIYRRLLRYVLPYWFIFLVAILANIVYSSVDAWFVHFIQPLLNKGFIERVPSFVRLLPAIILGAFVIRGSASVCSNYFMARVARNVVMVFRQELFRHFQCMPAQAYDNSSTGKLLSSIIYNVQQVANASADALTTFLQAIILVCGLLFVMFNISWQLSIIYFCTLPFIIWIVSAASRRTRKLSVNIQDSIGTITSIAEENLDGYRIVRTFGGQAYEEKRFNKATDVNRNREMKVVVTKVLSIFGVQFVAGVALSFLIYLATTHYVTGLTAGAFSSIAAAMLALLKPMKDITNVNSKIQKGLAAAQSVFELLDEPIEKDKGALSISKANGHIRFEGIHFNYQSSEQPVLKNVNFSVEPGQIVALVGRSGSGKSTLMSLLLRFYDCEHGHIMLDDHSIYDYKLHDYRSQFSFVSQQVVLFNDTVKNNIAYGISKDQASDEAIRKAARAAHAMEFIDNLPDGFDTVVGDNGVLLSGGQRQRLALARAILKDAPILLLDEATSALDTESERFIQDALDELMHQRTTIVIAHRLSTIKQADKIIVMDHGKVQEEGRHDMLLARDGYYAKLYQMQFGSDAQ